MPEIKLYHGDCIEVMQNFQDNSIDLVVTSPPYDDLRIYNSNVNWKDMATTLFRIVKECGVLVWNVNDTE